MENGIEKNDSVSSGPASAPSIADKARSEDRAMGVAAFVNEYQNEWADMVAIQNRHTDRDHLSICGMFSMRSQFFAHLRSLEDMHMDGAQ